MLNAAAARVQAVFESASVPGPSPQSDAKGGVAIHAYFPKEERIAAQIVALVVFGVPGARVLGYGGRDCRL